jgi:hypothetical protein
VSFAPSYFLFNGNRIEDFPASSINISVSDESTEINSATEISGGNPDNDGHSLFQELADEPDEPLVKKRKADGNENTRTSWIWDHFEKIDGKKEFALCKICGDEVYYSRHYSTSMLVRHVRRHHKQVYTNHLEAEADAKLASENKASGCQ